MKVLIVDDSSTMRRIVKKVLEDFGKYDYLEAANGLEAVNLSAEADVKLILMDWNMPEMAGIDAVKAIRGKGNKTPIVMVTTEAEKRRVIEAIQAGINDYLVKPFTPDQLSAKIQKFLTPPTP
jgi:two-component system, chemotaxis family, chemotaxis protein CheY